MCCLTAVMSVVDELRNLEMYLTELNKQGQPIADLYEMVQYAGIVICTHVVTYRECAAETILVNYYWLCIHTF